MIQRADCHVADHRFAAQIVNGQQVAGQNILHLLRPFSVKLITAHQLDQFIGGNDNHRISAFKHPLSNAIHQKRLAQSGSAGKQKPFPLVGPELVRVLLAEFAIFPNITALALLSSLNGRIRKNTLVESVKIFVLKPLQAFVLIKLIQNRPFEACARFMNRFPDISGIFADCAAIHRLQIVFRQAVLNERRAQFLIQAFHFRFHVPGNLFRLFGRSKRATHAGIEKFLPFVQQRRNFRAFSPRFFAALSLGFDVACALGFQIAERFAHHVFAVHCPSSSSSKFTTAALYVARRSSGV